MSRALEMVREWFAGTHVYDDELEPCAACAGVPCHCLDDAP